jgi:ABC-2 type transport system ATP-binding protein
MAQIIVEGLSKFFQVAERRPGLWGAVSGLLRRDHRSVPALQDVSFEINAGELVGYIGPNGAGKSTTIKILSGILVPTAGRCEVRGRVPWLERHQHVADIGVVFGQRSQLWWDLPVMESFDLLRDIYRVPASEYRDTRDQLIAEMSIEPLLATPVRQLSLGQRMRCDLVASLLHCPSILFLDEPTIGLDAVSRLALRHFIRRINRERGTTIILTTHDMDDIEALCERVIVIGRGTILSDGPLAGLREQLDPERRMKVELVNDERFDVEHARVISREGTMLQLSFDPRRITTPELIRRISESHEVRDLLVEYPPIEELIAKLYADSADSKPAVIEPSA